MATVAITASMMFSRTNVEAGVPSTILTGTAGDVVHDTIQTIGFAAQEAIGLGLAGAGGWIYLQNLDGTNFIEIAQASTDSPFAKLLPGEFAMFPLHSGSVPVAKAATAACEMRVVVFEAAP